MIGMVAWYIDEGVGRLIAQWKAEHPGAVVYTIGDSSHSGNPDVSQHAPDRGGSAPGDDRGEVDAADFMPGKGGVTMAELVALRNALRDSRDERILYLIIGDEIVSSRPVAGRPAWAIRKYSGKYHSHLHVSVNDRFDRNTRDWQLTREGPVPRKLEFIPLGETKVPELKLGDEDVSGATQWLWRVQRLLAVEDDGVYGRKTADALRRRMAGQSTYKPTTANGTEIGEPEWRVLYALWG